jgi:hypothetical protein
VIAADRGDMGAEAASCGVCGRSPALHVDLTKVTGLLTMIRWSKIEADLCRSCGMATVRKVQVHDLLAGWWGFAAFIANVIALAQAGRTWLRLRALPPPVGEPLRPPVPPAKPLLRTPVPYLVAVVVIGGAVWIGSAIVGGDHVGVEGVGRCVTLTPTSPAIDRFVPCDGLYDARIVGVAARISSCPAAADGLVSEDGDGHGVGFCVDLDA